MSKKIGCARLTPRGPSLRSGEAHPTPLQRGSARSPRCARRTLRSVGLSLSLHSSLAAAPWQSHVEGGIGCDRNTHTDTQKGSSLPTPARPSEATAQSRRGSGLLSWGMRSVSAKAMDSLSAGSRTPCARVARRATSSASLPLTRRAPAQGFGHRFC